MSTITTLRKRSLRLQVTVRRHLLGCRSALTRILIRKLNDITGKLCLPGCSCCNIINGRQRLSLLSRVDRRNLEKAGKSEGQRDGSGNWTYISIEPSFLVQLVSSGRSVSKSGRRRQCSALFLTDWGGSAAAGSNFFWKVGLPCGRRVPTAVLACCCP